MRAEFHALNRNKTWVLVPPPANEKIIPVHWILTKKIGANGEVLRYKARLVAQGNHQEPGQHFGETFAPVANVILLRILLTMAVGHNYQVFHLDVDNAFLHGEIDQLLYVSQPPHFYNKRSSGPLVCRLNKGLYGLKQAAHCWWSTLDKILYEIGFDSIPAAQGLYLSVKNRYPNPIWIYLYVDEILVICELYKDYKIVTKSLSEYFSLKDLGLLGRWFYRTVLLLILHQ